VVNGEIMYDKDNVFYKILRSEIPAKKIYENDVAVAFYDINPLCKIHALVIPKCLCRNFSEFVDMSNEKEIVLFHKTIEKVTKILGVTETGFRLITNNGPDSGQEVDHFHVHILAGEKLPGILNKNTREIENN
jgi:diadenosine tetraphosphate (Ap4A) HIT family hydrolase